MKQYTSIVVITIFAVKTVQLNGSHAMHGIYARLTKLIEVLDVD